MCVNGQLPSNIREWDRRLELIEFKLFELFKVNSIQFDKELVATGVVKANLSVSGKLVQESFNYFLLDPQELDHVKQNNSIQKNFEAFCQSIFYVGKGKEERPEDHPKKAKEVSHL